MSNPRAVQESTPIKTWTTTPRTPHLRGRLLKHKQNEVPLWTPRFVLCLFLRWAEGRIG